MTMNRHWYWGLFLFVFVGLWIEPAHAYKTKVSEEGHTMRWSEKKIELHLHRTFVDRFGPIVAFESANLAASAWSGIEGAPEIVIVDKETSHRSQGGSENTIHLMQPWVGESGQLALTRSVNNSKGVIVGVDILVNGEMAIELLLGDENRADYDLAGILSHEMGHVLGLDEAPEVPEATMFPEIGPGETHQRTPSEDDFAGISAIYSEELTLGAPCAYSPGVGRIRPSGFAWLCGLGLLLFYGRRERRGRIFDTLDYSSSRSREP